VIAACVAGSATNAADGTPMFPPGLRMGLEPAGNLKPNQGAAGFSDPEHQVAVTIVELPPASFDGVSKAMFGTAPSGATEIKRELFPFRSGIGYLHTARVTENGVTSNRWLLLVTPAGTPEEFVALISVTVPEAASNVYPDALVRKMLASVTMRAPPIQEQLGLIPFTVDNLANFRVARVTPGSVLMVDGWTDDISGQPYMVVSIGSAPQQKLEDRARFSRDLLATLPFRELSVQSADEMRIGGDHGIEFRIRAKSPTGRPVAMVQWVRFTGGGFLRYLGVAPAERWDELFPRFRAVRDGVDLR
jgi:hypothetical protein